MPGAQFASIDDFRSYILRKLGYPVIQVELDNTQLDDIIYDCVQDFQRYNYSEGSYPDYLIFTLSANVREYSLSGTNIEDIYDLSLSTGPDGINVLFSPANMLLGPDLAGMGGIPGASNQGASPGLSIAGYQIAQMYLEEIQNSFGREYMVDYRPWSQKLSVTPTPTTSGIGLLSLYRNEDSIYLYSNPLVKKLAVGRAKKLWGGLILNKYSMSLPGGGTINGEAIYQQGLDEETRALDDIKQESEGPIFFIG